MTKKKTIFEHAEDIFGSQKKQFQKSLLSGLELKKFIMSMAIFVVLGFLIGLMIDIVLGTGFIGYLFAIAALILWIFKNFRKYIFEEKKEKETTKEI